MRLVEKEDILQLSKLRIEQQKDDWQEEFEDKYNLFEKTTEYLNSHLNKDLYIFVEEVKNEIIATCGLQIVYCLPQCNDNGKEGLICNVFTKKQYRNQGIQTKLLQEVLKYAKERDLCEIGLFTDSNQAISIYKKFGFTFNGNAMKLIL